MEPASARPGQSLINSARKTQQEFEDIFKSRGGFPQVCQPFHQASFSKQAKQYAFYVLQVDLSNKADENSAAPAPRDDKPQEFKLLGPVSKSSRSAWVNCTICLACSYGQLQTSCTFVTQATISPKSPAPQSHKTGRMYAHLSMHTTNCKAYMAADTETIKLLYRIQGANNRAEPGPVSPGQAQPEQSESDKGRVNIFSGESPAGKLCP